MEENPHLISDGVTAFFICSFAVPFNSSPSCRSTELKLFQVFGRRK